MTASEILGRSAGAAAQAFGQALMTGARDATAILKTVRGLKPPIGTSYGRYSAGADPLVPYSAAATDVSSLIAQGVSLRQNVALAEQAMIDAAELAPATFASAMFAAAESLRLACADPGDALRLFEGLSEFDFTIPAPGGDQEGRILVRLALAASLVMRRGAGIGLARASADYVPNSQGDAAARRNNIGDVLDRIAEEAADQFDDRTTRAIDTLRVATVNDLTARGASLSPIVTRSFNANLPAIVLAYRLYQNADRGDELLARNEASTPHPAFMPTTIEALAE